MTTKIVPRSLTRVELPLPPSVNNLFATVGRKRVKTREYKDWAEDAGAVLVELKKPPPGPVAIDLRVIGRVDPRRDLDNLLKPIGDLLVASGVIPDDTVKTVVRWQVQYLGDDGSEAAPVVVVRVFPASSRADV